MEFLGSTQQILIAATLGYIGYWFAYHGFGNEKEDRLYKTLIFGLMPLFVLKITHHYNFNIWLTLVAIIGIALLNSGIGIFWRLWGKDMLFKILNNSKISNENNIDTVLNEITQSNYAKVRLTVYLKDGSQYISYVHDHRENELPFNPCRIDKDGNVLMYIDEYKLPNAEWEKNKIYGSSDKNQVTITYIAKEDIQLIDFKINTNNKRNK